VIFNGGCALADEMSVPSGSQNSPRSMLPQPHVLLWRVAALVSLVLGAAGIVLPVLPTVPFFILAAWAASKGWPALEIWLLEHRTYGPHIRLWRERGAIPRRAKWLATLMMLASAIVLQFSAAPLWAQIGAPVTMFLVAVWLWRRPTS
jgi:uncharacterized protein